MNNKTITIQDVRYLRGPNIWTYRPVIEAIVDIGGLEECPSNVLPGFNQRLTAWLPSLIEHRCSEGVRGGFLQRLEEGTWPAHILEHVTLELQTLSGMQTGFGKARSTSKTGVYKVAIRSRQEEVSRRAIVLGRDLIMAAIEDRPFDVKAAIAELTDMVDSLCIGPSTSCIVDAAAERKIPHIRLLADGNLVQLGYAAAQRRIWTAETDCTSAIAEGIASDKDMTKQLLSYCGVPIPEGRVVDSPADAWDAAQDIGLPVVVKPSDANHGRGVSAELMTQAEVEAAFVVADREGSDVIVERFLRGAEHRLLVIGGKLVAAARGEEAAVIGDGKSSILQLIESQLNSDPRRGAEEEFPLDIIDLDALPASQLEIARQGYTPASVPAADQRVLIMRNGNHSSDVTHLVHPKVASAAVLAAKIVGLDVAGIDVVAEDISRPLDEQGAGIVEVNAGPGLLMHLKPAEGKAQPVGEAIVESLFPRNANGRVPVVGVSGSYGKTRVAGLIARLLRLSGKYVGLACSKGAYVNRRHLQTSDAANWAGGERMLLNRSVTAAVIENGARAILSEGLAYDRCDIGVVTNLAHKPELDEFYVHDDEQLYNVLRTQVDVVLPTGAAILNADDERVAEMAELCDGEVLFFSVTPDSAVVATHRAAGGRAVFARDKQIVLAKGTEEKALTDLSTIPLIAEDSSGVQVGNVLAAIAAAWALNIDSSLIKSGAQTFGSPG